MAPRPKNKDNGLEVGEVESWPKGPMKEGYGQEAIGHQRGPIGQLALTWVRLGFPQHPLRGVFIHGCDNNTKGCRKLKDSFAETFVIKALHGENSVGVELSEELSNKNPKIPVRLIEPYKSCYAEKFPLRIKLPQHIPHVE
ncbi:hypothetical protein O181_083487 [Austropuccinia psidii MF-1]|uniref:Uncharacterized protein n=1 Tax=Austropuccinia psidii MF-1 TaxID=1389203 RepID=A0A9Q3FSF6_9BASI|nr:hypothetical protein [Austropuccinia psidii MF-1]